MSITKKTENALLLMEALRVRFKLSDCEFSMFSAVLGAIVEKVGAENTADLCVEMVSAIRVMREEDPSSLIESLTMEIPAPVSTPKLEDIMKMSATAREQIQTAVQDRVLAQFHQDLSVLDGLLGCLKLLDQRSKSYETSMNHACEISARLFKVISSVRFGKQNQQSQS